MFKKMSTSRKGRKCKYFGCKHVLSIYNHATYCNLHAEHKPSSASGDKAGRNR